MRAPLQVSLSLAALVVLQQAGGSGSAQPVRPASVPHSPSVTGAGNSYAPVFSASGRFVAFVSHANNLVTNDDLGPHLDLFVRDLVVINTVLVSVNTNGIGGGNDDVVCAALSSNGQYVAFETAASDLVPNDTNRAPDIFVRDTVAGTTTLVSVNADGTGSGNGPSWGPLISEDGRYVVFESAASDLVTNDFNGTNDIFVRDLVSGVTTLVSVNADGTASPDGPSYSPSISASGLFVAFASQATNLVAGVTNRLGEIYLRDVAGGSNLWTSASRLYTSPPYSASQPVLSADGRYVTFKTQRGAVVRFDSHEPTNTVVKVFPGQSPISHNYYFFVENPRLVVYPEGLLDSALAVSADGRFAALTTGTNKGPTPTIRRIDFESFVTNVFHYCCDGTSADYYVTNQFPADALVSSNIPALFSINPAMSADGGRIVFLAGPVESNSPGPVIPSLGVYFRDMATDTSYLLSTNGSGAPGPDLNGVIPATTTDGSLVA